MATETTDDLRSTISASIETLESGGGEGASVSGVSPTPSGPVPGTPGAAATSVGAPSAATQVAAPVATPVGSIPPKEGTDPAAPPPGTKQESSGTAGELKAPGTWNPQARELWKDTHPAIQQEIVRRERETSRAMTQSTEARKFQKAFQEAIRPFEGFIAAERSDPIKATVNMMQTAAMLKTGTPVQKANLVASVIKEYGVDLMMLDGLLAGQQPSAATAEDYIAREVAKRTQPILERMTARDREIEQSIDSEVTDELTEFAKNNEFYEDVKDIMADLMETNHKRGGNMGLTEAYASATLLSEPVRLTLEGRKSGQSAQRGHQIAQQARSGAISVKPSDETGVTGIAPAGDSIRDSINFAIQKTSGR